jgi:DNA-binding HxlR family transcriptional regulator
MVHFRSYTYLCTKLHLMYERKIPLPLECGLSLTKEVLNGKWKANIIYLISIDVQRPSDIQRALPDATKRVLNLQLKELDTHGIISKKIYHQLPPKVEYSLTPLGKSLIPVIMTLNDWGEHNRGFLEEIISQKGKAEVAVTAE